MYKATVRVTLRNSILDPQGKASRHALNNLGLQEVDKVRIGKLIELEVNADSEDQARSITETACKQLLANPVMEDFEIDISKA
jgi:phosphoribosylformylglycinamidine synthase